MADLLENGSQQQEYRSDTRRPMQFRGTCYKCNQRGHMARDCPTRETGVCEHCKNPGHSMQNCAIRDKQIKDF